MSNPMRPTSANESVIIRGDTKYMSRGGKFYKYKGGKRTEITSDEYNKVLGPRVQGRPDVQAKAQNKNSIKLKIDGRTYSASHPDMSAKDLAAKVSDMAKHSPGRAIQWLKKNGSITHVGEKAPAKKSEPEEGD